MSHKKSRQSTPGLIVLFGSGEMSPTGRKIHEEVFRRLGLTSPVSIGILETPTGFEVNAIHAWPERMEEFFKKSLQDYKPEVSRIRAWRKDGDKSTDDPKIVDPILDVDYLYCGAGSPGYTIRHLRGSRAWENMEKAFEAGTTLCLGSASAVAAGRYAIPVYEIFKAGEDLHWLDGLDFFKRFSMKLAIVPHWNNKEGEDFDTTRCWMGRERFNALAKLLPAGVTILGIDEETALVFDTGKKQADVLGVGSVHIIKNGKEKTIRTDSSLTFSQLW